MGLNIINHLNIETRACHPDQQMLGARLGVSQRAIVRRVGLIERAGWLAIRRLKGSKGKHGRPANEYLPTIPKELVAEIQVTSSVHLDGKTQVTSLRHVGPDPSDAKAQIQVTSRRHPFREGIGKERGSGEEKREAKELALKDTPIPLGQVFVEMDSAEWDAWRRARGKSLRNYTVRIGGKLKWGCFCRSAWPTSELPSRLNGGSAQLAKAVG